MKLMRDTVTGWMAVFSRILLLLFIVPFIIRHVGVDAFGIWSFTLSIVGLAELLDVGLANTVVKYTSHTAAKQEMSKRHTILSTIFYSYILLSGMGAIILALLTPSIPYLFALPLQDRSSFYSLITLLGIRTFCISLPFSLYRGLLFGEGKIALTNLISLLGVLFNGLFIIFFLFLGSGIISLGLASLISALIEFGLYFLYGHRLVAIRWQHVNIKNVYPIIGSFTLSQLANNIGSIVLNHADIIIVKLFLPLSDVACYAVASRLVNYCYLALKQFTNALTPTIVHLDALQQPQEVRNLYLLGTRYASLLGLVMLVGGILFSKPFICWWLGTLFLPAVPLIQILLVSLFFRTLYFLAGDILQMTGYHVQLVRYLSIEIAVHVAVATLAAATIGLIGVPIGSLASTLAGFFLDFKKICSLYQLTLRKVLRVCLFGM